MRRKLDGLSPPSSEALATDKEDNAVELIEARYLMPSMNSRLFPSLCPRRHDEPTIQYRMDGLPVQPVDERGGVSALVPQIRTTDRTMPVEELCLLLMAQGSMKTTDDILVKTVRR